MAVIMCYECLTNLWTGTLNVINLPFIPHFIASAGVGEIEQPLAGVCDTLYLHRNM